MKSQSILKIYAVIVGPDVHVTRYTRADGTQFLELEEDAVYLPAGTPEFIESTDPHFEPFLAACAAGTPVEYAEKHWQATEVECVSDFAGSRRHPGAWVDLYERPDGTRFLRLGGEWRFYGPSTPTLIDATDPHFEPFLAACADDTDFGYAKEHWSDELISHIAT